MTAVIFKRTESGLAPIDAPGRKFLARTRIGDLVPVRVTVPRNIRLFNKYWAFCGFVAHHSAKFQSAEQASDWIKIGVGHCHMVETRGGIRRLPLSISWAKMDDLEFEAFWNRVCDFVVAELMPHVTQKELEAELANFVGIGAAMWRDDR